MLIKAYVPLSDGIIDEHLRGKTIAGIYPLLPDECCWFLAFDFDDEEWQKDINVIREVCGEFGIPIAVERSRSGNGAHLWVFFEHTIAASIARKLGTAILTFAMSRRHEMNFKSYDRLFPNQDTMPKGGFGNLIALPLQKAARDKNNSFSLMINSSHTKISGVFLQQLENFPRKKLKLILLSFVKVKNSVC